MLPRLRSESARLADQPGFLATVYSRAREPRTFALAANFRELRRLENDLLPNPEALTL
jgi:hypothetical protein